MKMNGTEEIIKLLLEVKVSGGGIKNPERTENLEKTLHKVDEMIRKDEFIRSGKVNNDKTEVQFTKNLNESPKEYLHRISTEVINLRVSDKTNLNYSEHSRELNSKDVEETVTRSGLLIELLFIQKENSKRTLADFNNKWLFRVIALVLLVLLVLLIYFLLI